MIRPETAREPKTGLIRQLGLFDATMILCGIVIGSYIHPAALGNLVDLLLELGVHPGGDASQLQIESIFGHVGGVFYIFLQEQKPECCSA